MISIYCSQTMTLIYNNDKYRIKQNVMHVNCSHGKGIKFIREDLKHFAKTHINTQNGSLFKSIILTNADKLTIDAQSALRRCIEVFSHTTRFFIVVEDKYKLLRPILSRFCEIYIPEPVIDNKIINLYQYNLNKVFKKKNSFKGKIGIFDIKNNKINHRLNFYKIEDKKITEIF